MKRCDAVVWKRDTYRRSGRTKSGLKLHYSKEQCSRRAVSGAFCRQHTNPASKPLRWSKQWGPES